MKLGKLIDLDLHIDDRGCLSEIFRSDAPYFKGFGQVYIIKDEAPGIIRAFHMHKRKEDYFFVSSGKALVILADGARTEIPFRNGVEYDYSNCTTKKYVLDSQKPQLLVIPKGIYHGWKSLVPNTHLINVVTEPFHKEDPDDNRIPCDEFGQELWEIEYK